MKLTEIIISEMDQILQEWQDFAQTLQSAKLMDKDALRDHAKVMIESIVKDMSTEQTQNEEFNKSIGHTNHPGKESKLIDKNAKDHALSRVIAGFGIRDLVSEYRALRASVLRLLVNSSNYTAQLSNISEILRFNEAVDQALAECIMVYALEREQQSRLFETVLSVSPDHNYILDLEGKFVYANKSLANKLSITMEEIVGKSFFDLGINSASELQEQLNKVVQSKTALQGEVTFDLNPNKHDYYEYILTPVFNPEGQLEAIAGTDRDITDRKMLADEIWHKANYDLITDLPNIRLFRDRLEQIINHSKRTTIQVAILFIDLDQFKEVNDTLGHHAGDLLLKKVAEKIRSCVRLKDTVARLGGDEFVVILSEFNQITNIRSIADKILKELSNPFVINGVALSISSSIGISLFPKDATSPDHLLRNADSAMYVAKSAGGNQFNFFFENSADIAT